MLSYRPPSSNWMTPPPEPGQVVFTDKLSGAATLLGDPPKIDPLPPAFSFGDPASGKWESLAENAPVSRGDVLRMSYRLKIPFLERWQTGAVLSKLQEDPRFRIRYFALHDEINTLIVEAEIVGSFKSNPIPAVAILVAGAITAIAVGVGVWMAAVSVEKLGTFDFSEVSQGKLNITALLVGGVLLFFLLSVFRKGGGG